MLLCVVQRGETALHMAARAGQVEVVRCLLRNGAIVDARARVRLLLSIVAGSRNTAYLSIFSLCRKKTLEKTLFIVFPLWRV